MLRVQKGLKSSSLLKTSYSFYHLDNPSHNQKNWVASLAFVGFSLFYLIISFLSICSEGSINNTKTSTELADNIYDLNTSCFPTIFIAMQYADSPYTNSYMTSVFKKNEALKKEFEYQLKQKSTPLLKLDFKVGAWVLDALWGQFFATGEVAPIKRITEALSLQKTLKNNKILSIVKSARWSLISNALQHKQVYTILQKLIKEEPKNIYLIEVLKEVDKEKKLGKTR